MEKRSRITQQDIEGFDRVLVAFADFLVGDGGDSSSLIAIVTGWSEYIEAVLEVVPDELIEAVRDHLRDHPNASSAATAKALGRWQRRYVSIAHKLVLAENEADDGEPAAEQGSQP